MKNTNHDISKFVDAQFAYELSSAIKADLDKADKKIIQLSEELKKISYDKMELVEALEEVSPLIDALINRTKFGTRRDELCDINIKIKSVINKHKTNNPCQTLQ